MITPSYHSSLLSIITMNEHVHFVAFSQTGQKKIVFPQILLRSPIFFLEQIISYQTLDNLGLYWNRRYLILLLITNIWRCANDNRKHSLLFIVDSYHLSWEGRGDFTTRVENNQKYSLSRRNCFLNEHEAI